MNKNLLEMAKRHRNMIMDVATAISQELRQNDSFQPSPGDVLRLAAASLDEQREILAKYSGEGMANMIIGAAKALGAKNVAETLDARDAQEKPASDLSDLEESLAEMTNRVMDDKSSGFDEPMQYAPQDEDGFVKSLDDNSIIGVIKIGPRSIYLTGHRDGDDVELRLTEFEYGEKTDNAVVGDDIGDAFNHFASEAMNLMMEEKGNQVLAQAEFDQEEEMLSKSEDAAIHSAVTEVMQKIFTGNIDGLRKAG